MAKKDKEIKVLIKSHKDRNGGHPHVIIENIDDCHVSVGLSTHQKKGANKKAGNNYRLKKSPLNDGKHSYMRRQGTVNPTEEYYNPRSGTMIEPDFQKAVEYGERAKQKYIEKKAQKKQRVPLPKKH